MYSKYFKRGFDFLFSFIALLALSPLILVVAVVLHFANEGAGVWFRQERPGYGGKIFRIIKFKTMNDRRGANGELLSDEERLTRVGSMVRSLSLDELPQLFNVLMGDMSFIGPRPLLVRYLDLYSPEQKRRHSVRPGMSGWAQVNGRNAISWTRKFELDVWYVDNVSFGLDVKIVLMTINRVVKRKDISSSTSATMEAFNGEN